MLLIYMPAEVAITCASIASKKTKEDIWTCCYDYFIDYKGEKYIYYDYMLI